RGAEMEAGVLWIAVEPHFLTRRLEMRGKVDHRPAGQAVDRHLALLMGKWLPILAVPVDGYAMPTEHRPGLFVEHFLMRLIALGFRRFVERAAHIIEYRPLAKAEQRVVVCGVLPFEARRTVARTCWLEVAAQAERLPSFEFRQDKVQFPRIGLATRSGGPTNP